MRFRAEHRGATLAPSARTLEAADREAALAALEPEERLGLRSLRPEDERTSPAQALSALARLLERGVPLSGELGALDAGLNAEAQAAAARGEPLSGVLAAEPSAPAFLVDALAGAGGEHPAAFVRLGARWLHRLEGARRARANELAYPLCLFALTCLTLGVVLGTPVGVEPALLPGATVPAIACGLLALVGGGVWLRARWGRPGPRSAGALGFRLQALALLVRAEVELARGWSGVWGALAPAPSEGDPCGAIGRAAGLGAAEGACLAHAMGLGPEAFADELEALGEVRLAWAEAALARQAAGLRWAAYAVAAAVALGGGLQRMLTLGGLA